MSTNKFDYHVYAMFFIHELRPTLNVQSESIRPKVLCISFFFFFFVRMLLLSVYIANLFILLTCKYIYIIHSPFNFTIHLIMTELRSKRRVSPSIFIVKSFKKPLLVRSPILIG